MRNSFLPPMPTSQLYGVGSNEFWKLNPDTYSMLDSKINVHTNCLLSFPKLFHCADIEQANLLFPANPPTVGDDIVGYGSSSNSSRCNDTSSMTTNNHCVSHSTQLGVYDQKRKRFDGEESMAANEKMKRRKPSHLTNPMYELNHYNNHQQQVPLRRSQKIGDRITALQKLVSPYGKTDTASVLQEATLYIKLLQDQIQNQFQMLGSPYGSINIRYLQAKEIEEKTAMDLRRRGLCLIPVSSIQDVTKDDKQT